MAEALRWRQCEEYGGRCSLFLCAGNVVLFCVPARLKANCCDLLAIDCAQLSRLEIPARDMNDLG